MKDALEMIALLHSALLWRFELIIDQKKGLHFAIVNFLFLSLRNFPK